MFEGQAIRVQRMANQFAELCFDRREQSVNKFDALTVEELRLAVEAIRAARGVLGVMVTSAKPTFVVGADIFEFACLFKRPLIEIEARFRATNDVFTRLSDLPIPSIAAINGVALGGGFEVALACDMRVMASDAQVGLPEVSLGLFPGFGGTVRLPRLASLVLAADWICNGTPRGSRDVLQSGVVDAVSTREDLRGEAQNLLLRSLVSGEWRERRRRLQGPASSAGDIPAFLKHQVAQKAPHEPAALAALELMEKSTLLSRDEALNLESHTFAEIAHTQAATALSQLFVSEQLVRRKARELSKAGRRVTRAAVVGLSNAGIDIASASASNQIPVDLHDTDPKTLQSGMTAAVDLVLETGVDELGVRTALLQEIEQHTEPTSIIASNTSLLPVTTIGESLRNPARYIGAHFSQPVAATSLVEIVRGALTSEAAVGTTVQYATAIGRTSVVVRECTGLLVDRVRAAYILGFLRLVHAGADFRFVDDVLEEFGWSMGPARLQDMLGIATLHEELRLIAGSYGSRMGPSFPWATKVLIDGRRLGRAAGKGYYMYEDASVGTARGAADTEAHPLLAQFRSAGEVAFTHKTVRERVMLPLILEAIRCFEEGICSSAEEIDLAIVLGLGFPRYVGGPLMYADWLGLAHIVERCDSYRELGPLYEPTSRMRALSNSGGTFYGRSDMGR
jgi:3-hydroxyacyl-CoA dehydrogenase/enoyl-CoA hydratase/3-hydroxybutyryl-CoA epimerase/enoyl-CoA isomerase